MPAVVGVSVPVQLVPATVALLQLAGATLAESDRPTRTAVAVGETLPASETAVPAMPVVGAAEMAIDPEPPDVPPDC